VLELHLTADVSASNLHEAMRELAATAARWFDERITGTAPGVRREVMPTRLAIRTTCGFHDD